MTVALLNDGPGQITKHLRRIFAATFLFFFTFPGSAYSDSWGSYEGTLKLEDVAALYDRDIPDDVGHTEFKLMEDYTFVTKDGLRYTVPAGHVINGASIPRVVWTVVGGPWSGRYRNASVIHDHMVDVRFEDSKTTHRLFYEAMLASEVSGRLAKIMYFAVVKGGSTWERGTGFFPPSVSKGSLTAEELIEFSRSPDIETLSLDEIDQLAN